MIFTIRADITDKNESLKNQYHWIQQYYGGSNKKRTFIKMVTNFKRLILLNESLNEEVKELKFQNSQLEKMLANSNNQQN